VLEFLAPETKSAAAEASVFRTQAAAREAPEPIPFNAIPVRRSKGAHPALNPPGPELIALRAFKIFLARGQVHGYDREDWEQAKRELGVSRNASAEERRGPPTSIDRLAGR
jgi:hypothetical protein